MVRIRIEKPIDETELRRLYLDEKQASGDIATIMGVTRSRVQYALKTYGVPQRSRSEAAKMREQRPDMVEFRRKQLAEAQTKITPEGRKRQGVAVSGPRNPWSDEVRAKHTYRQTARYRERLSAAQKGEKAHNWQGGKTSLLGQQINTWEWRKRRNECYQRDNWTCLDCETMCVNTTKKDKSRVIQCHHLVARRDGGSDELSNLVTLCARCHGLREAAVRAARVAETR